jgi:hypothetical protein
MLKKTKIISNQGYNPASQRLVFVNFSDDLGCYFVTLIDANQGADKKHTVKLCMTMRESSEIAESWLTQSGT